MYSQDDVNRFQRRLAFSWFVMAALAVLLLMPQIRRWMGVGITGDPRPVTARGDLAEFEKTSINVFQSAGASVVYINTRQRRFASRFTRQTIEIESGTGSGFVWDEHGHIVTNYHVIKDASSAEVIFADQSAFEATLVGKSPNHDLAVLKVNASTDLLRPVMIGESHDLQEGQSVFAIGRPFGLAQSYSAGIVSNRSRSLKIPGGSGREIEDVIQTDAAINPGNSGGPLLDTAARLIGVNTAIYSPSGGSAGVGFAIPVDTVNRVVPELIANGEYKPPSLGIVVDSYINSLAATQAGVSGIVVVSVQPGGPADKAGLQGVTETTSRMILGDVITVVSGKQVETLNDLFAILEKHSVGDQVTLTILREGVEQNVELTLQERPGIQ
ncbi:MAG: trypsin-like peptidase domain-containing protein [Fuerstiella sp.]|nr:trypsin-like peptidase domain-containing protein [Fuerstiella sp.]